MNNTDWLITLFPAPNGEMDCQIHSEAKIRFWSMDNVVEVSRFDSSMRFPSTVVSLNGSVNATDSDGGFHSGNTSRMYLLAAQRQGLTVEYIEDTYSGYGDRDE